LRVSYLAEEYTGWLITPLAIDTPLADDYITPRYAISFTADIAATPTPCFLSRRGPPAADYQSRHIEIAIYAVSAERQNSQYVLLLYTPLIRHYDYFEAIEYY